MVFQLLQFLNEFVTPFCARSQPPNQTMLEAMVPVKFWCCCTYICIWLQHTFGTWNHSVLETEMYYMIPGLHYGLQWWVMVLEYSLGQQMFSHGNWSWLVHTNCSSMMTVTPTFVYKKEPTIFWSACLTYVNLMHGLLPVEDIKVKLTLCVSWMHTRWVEVELH